MNVIIKPLTNTFVLPFKATPGSAGYDIPMPQAGYIPPHAPEGVWVDLGFEMEFEIEYVAILLPRSGAGTKKGLGLNNTVGIIDSDYRSQVKACLRVFNNKGLRYSKNECLLQMLFLPVASPELIVSDILSDSERMGGFGSTG